MKTEKRIEVINDWYPETKALLDSLIKAGFQIKRVRAWTGGKGNYKGCKHRDFGWLRRWFFRRQLRECGGLDLWACAGTSALERARIFWNRASLDAFATLDLN